MHSRVPAYIIVFCSFPGSRFLLGSFCGSKLSPCHKGGLCCLGPSAVELLRLSQCPLLKLLFFLSHGFLLTDGNVFRLSFNLISFTFWILFTFLFLPTVEHIALLCSLKSAMKLLLELLSH